MTITILLFILLSISGSYDYDCGHDESCDSHGACVFEEYWDTESHDAPDHDE